MNLVGCARRFCAKGKSLMNILHLKYAVEVAKCGSINKAAEALYMNQPNLSKAIKELESSLGITIFERTAKGMNVTPEGEDFLSHAKKILRQIDEMEAYYRAGLPVQQRFSLAAPRASYISQAFAQFSKQLDNGRAEIFYKETNTAQALQSVLSADYKLGILRYAADFDRYYKDMLEEKGLNAEVITEFHFVLLMNRAHPLAEKADISFDDLRPYIEIAHADPDMPSLPLSAVKKEELPDETERRIYVFERGSQMNLLSENPETFMWVSPIPGNVLAAYGLTQKVCRENKRLYKDMLIYKKDYHLTESDKQFITELCNVKRQCKL